MPEIAIHRRGPLSCAVLLVVAAVAAGCGSDDDDDPAPATPAAAATTAEAPTSADLQAFLLRDGEEPGFRPAGRPTTESFDAFAAQVTPQEAAELRRAGFASITVQPLSGSGDAAGVTNVQLFETAEGARATLAYENRADVIRARLPKAEVRRFTVQGLPGARGWTSPTPDGPPVGNVHWVQGRCLLVLGNQGSGPMVERLSQGALAIHRRTGGRCP